MIMKEEIREKAEILIPIEISLIKEAFEKHNKNIYIVGGAVRDFLMEEQPKDFDLCTDVLPQDVQKILNEAAIYNFPKGEAFGVISAVINQQEFEIATLRTESYELGDGRRPTSVEFSDLRGDVSRRDLTINALYYDLNSNEIIDFVGGIEDCENKMIRAVGNVEDRFNEDKLRVLRIIRFSNRYGASMNDETINAIIKYSELIGVSNERIRNEFLSSLKQTKSVNSLIDDYYRFGIFKRMFPGITVDSNVDDRDFVLVLSVILHNNEPKKLFSTLTNLTCTVDEKSNIMFFQSIYHFFRDFKKENFKAEIDSKKLMNLKKSIKEKNDNITKEQMVKFATYMSLDENIISNFYDFKPAYSAADFPDVAPSKELGDAICLANTDYFLKLI